MLWSLHHTADGITPFTSTHQQPNEICTLCCQTILTPSTSWKPLVRGSFMTSSTCINEQWTLHLSCGLQVGASQKLACVIDGESLMNDGSALVIFLLLQKIVEGQQVTVGGVSCQALNGVLDLKTCGHSASDDPGGDSVPCVELNVTGCGSQHCCETI